MQKMKKKCHIYARLMLSSTNRFKMWSLVIVLLFPSITYSMSIRRCEKTEEETWGLKIGLCIESKDFHSKRTDCSVHRPDVGGGLITEGNGFRVVVHDKCVNPNPFIITTTKQTHFGVSHSYIEFSNSNMGTPESIPECSKHILISVYCDQEASGLDFHTLKYVESSELHVTVKYDTSCINHLGVNYSFMNECDRKLLNIYGRDTLTCGAPNIQTRDKYLTTCTNTKFDRSVYKKHIHRSKVLHTKTEL
ncbi:Virulence factor [Orthopoxvirus akhmetapox]|uniref:Virulence factor n=1 Tax=Orthopoxvirus akhmetapox TaxID=2200830 RepID=A0A5J6CTF0_9POXV|nr:Virulence factor [Akhmeta virus]QEQ49955.1 Virulence factor [Akhmeta virus]